MSKIKRGDAIQLVHNCEVITATPQYLTVMDKERNFQFDIQGEKLISEISSGSYFGETKEVSKTEAAEILLRTHGRIFTVEFVKQDGKLRTLRGYLQGVEELLGRSYCVDIDVEGPHKTRLVDHRTILSIIFNGIKYVVR